MEWHGQVSRGVVRSRAVRHGLAGYGLLWFVRSNSTVNRRSYDQEESKGS